MDTINLEAAPRETGKKATKAVRREGNVPCVLYGHGDEPVHFQVHTLALRPLIYTNESHRVKVALDGKSFDCILKAITYDPLTSQPTHADFQILHKGEKIHMTVPVRVLGTAAGQKAGGRVVQVLNEVGIVCLPKDIPSHIDVDVTNLEIGDVIHLGDIQVEGVVFEADDRQTVVTVVGAKAEVEEEAAEGLEGEEGAEEGEE